MTCIRYCSYKQQLVLKYCDNTGKKIFRSLRTNMISLPRRPGNIYRLETIYCVCVLLLQDLLQSCARGGRRRVEDMCYERHILVREKKLTLLLANPETAWLPRSCSRRMAAAPPEGRCGPGSHRNTGTSEEEAYRHRTPQTSFESMTDSHRPRWA